MFAIYALECTYKWKFFKRKLGFTASEKNTTYNLNYYQ